MGRGGRESEHWLGRSQSALRSGRERGGEGGRESIGWADHGARGGADALRERLPPGFPAPSLAQS